MEIKTSSKYCIITPFSPKLGEIDAKKLLKEIFANRNLKVGLDMSYVNECSMEFIDLICQIKNLALFNITSDVFAIFNIMNVDKKVDLFVSEIDFIAEKHKLINRKFSII